jgi:hypothetical protein
MNKKLFLLIACAFFLVPEVYAQRTVSSASFRSKTLTSCYRWMGKGAYKTWFGKKKPLFTPVYNDSTWLGRGGKKAKGIYCWTSPAASIRGGSSEFYGQYLMRIDLKPDTVIFDRNKGTYHRADGQLLPIDASEMKGVDSDVFYANYEHNGGAWFQEYIIKSEDAIVGWTFGDEKLQTDFEESYQRRISFSEPFTSHHFYFNYCPFVTTPEDADSVRDFHRDNKRYECERYRAELEEIKIFLETEVWTNPDHGQYILREP